MAVSKSQTTRSEASIGAQTQTHVLVVTTGSAGDLFPFLRLALGLQQRGHRVTVLAPHLHEPYAREAGLAFHGLTADPAVLADPDLWHPTRGFKVVWEATRPGMREALAYAVALPPEETCALVVHPLALPEADLCRAARPGTRVVGAYLAPSNLPTVHDPLLLGPLPVPRWVPHAVRRWLWRRIGAHVTDPVALPSINAARHAHGLAPAASLLDYLTGVPDLSVALFPDWFAARQPDWPQPLCMGDFPLYDAHPAAVLQPELQAFLAAGAPPLVFTHGTGNTQAVRYFADALAATGALGQRAIFLTPHTGQIPQPLPASVLWLDYLPLRALLPHVAALIHHGGIGTTAEALRAGIPQLIVALAYDQFDNGARVARLSAGLTLNAARATAASLRKALQTLLFSPAIQAGCLAASAQFGTATALETCLDSISKTISETGKN